MSAPSPPSGFLHSFRILSEGLLATVQERIELFTVELQEEKFRLAQTFIWISAVIFAGVMAIAFASLALVYFFWESARLGVLIGLTTLYTGALVALIVAFRRFLGRQPSPFAATLQALGDDRACIHNQS